MRPTVSDKKEYTPWKQEHEPLPEAVKQTRVTKEVEEGQLAVKGVRERMKRVLKKDQALKVSMYMPAPEPTRKEGEIWSDNNGRKWTMKNGKKEAYSTFQDVRRPWFCPKCGSIMNKQVDDRMWILRGKCFECVIKDETQMRIDGTWKSYEQEKMLSNQIAYLKDRIMELKDLQRTIGKPELQFQDGRFEKWNVSYKQIQQDMSEEVRQLEALLEQAEQIYAQEFSHKENA